MIYKHEQDIKPVVYGYAKYLGDDTVNDELDEVYKKAKAWDKYLETTVRWDAIDQFGADDPRVEFAIELSEKIYMEDK